MSEKNNLSTIYCAGPMFTSSEKKELAQISETLESNGYQTFLPPRDGLEIGKLYTEAPKQKHLMPVEELPMITHYIKATIFAIDVYNVMERCNAVVMNMNGRVPDEGACVEAAMAFAVGKPVIIYKDDVRSLFDGVDNPMVEGLTKNFRYVSSITDIPQVLSERLNHKISYECSFCLEHIPEETKKFLNFGREMFAHKNRLLTSSEFQQGKLSVIDILHELFGLGLEMDLIDRPQPLPIVPSEVEEGVFVGGLQSSLNCEALLNLGITHILTVGHFMPSPYPDRFSYKVIRIRDNKYQDLYSHFEPAVDFISNGRKSGGVLVHCLSGMSRSASLIIAYLIAQKAMSLKSAIDRLTAVRPHTKINPGFYKQLQDWEARYSKFRIGVEALQ